MNLGCVLLEGWKKKQENPGREKEQRNRDKGEIFLPDIKN